MKYVAFIAGMLATATLILFSGFTLPTEIALLVLVLAVTADFLTTWLCLKKKGREGNPVIAFAFRKVGVLGSFGILAGFWVCFIVFRWLGQAEGIQTAVAFAYWLVPMNNLVVLTRLNRKYAG